MRYGPNHKAETHKRILKAAGRMFRERGYMASGVDKVMRSAGLTAGGFYSHFASKQALLAETLIETIRDLRDILIAGTEELDGTSWLREVVRRYLNRKHRDIRDAGCALPSLISELTRSDEKTRATFEHHLRHLVRELEDKTPEGAGMSSQDRVLATIALCMGGLALSRSVVDPDLSNQILQACRRLAVQEEYECSTSSDN